jgi:putative oxidoreductase
VNLPHLPAHIRQPLLDVALLVLRVGMGAMLAFGHGVGKLQTLFGDGTIAFADPLGLGPALSLALAVFAEFFCALLVVIGAFTRLAVLPVLCTMTVALLIVHGQDAWAQKELAAVYGMAALTVLLAGPGRWSVDGK